MMLTSHAPRSTRTPSRPATTPRLGTLSLCAALSVSAMAMPVGAANLTWQAGTNGTWVDGGGSWVSGGPWSNANPDTFTHNSATRSQVTLSGALSAGFLQNLNGGLLTIGAGSSLSTTAGDNRIGSGAGASAAFHQNAGAVTIGSNGTLRIGQSGGYGFYRIEDGSLSLGTGILYIGRTPTATDAATGVLYQGGGVISRSNNIELSASANGSHSVYYMTGEV
jgi:hypothetical protein